MTLTEVTKDQAEGKLKTFIGRSYKAFTCTEKLRSRLLFQAAKGLGKITAKEKICRIDTTVTKPVPLVINKENIDSFDDSASRKPIKADACCKTVQGHWYLGEAKGTSDNTGMSAGYTHSCAHKVAYDLLKDSPINYNKYQGATHAFLSQPTGYLDAISHNRQKFTVKSLSFVWLFCDYDLNKSAYYSALGESLVENIACLFQHAPFLSFCGYKPSGICHYYFFNVDMKLISKACKCMCDYFVEKYLK